MSLNFYPQRYRFFISFFTQNVYISKCAYESKRNIIQCCVCCPFRSILKFNGWIFLSQKIFFIDYGGTTGKTVIFWTSGLAMFRWCSLRKVSLWPCTVQFHQSIEKLKEFNSNCKQILQSHRISVIRAAKDD